MTNDIRYAGLGYPMATQNADGTWRVPTYNSASTGTWGHFRIEVGATWTTTGTAVKTVAGTDITTINSVPTIIDSLSFGEPYGETTGQLTVPRVTPFDVPAWMTGGANVDIWRVLPTAEATSAGTAEVPYWHGLIASIEVSDGPGLDSSVSLQLVGALYGEASVRAHQPLMLDTSNDVGTWCGRALNPTAYSRPIPYFTRFTFQTTTTGIDTRYRGSRGQSVIDYMDELMVLAQDTTNQWTISRAYQTLGSKSYPRGRHYYLRTRAASMGTASVQQNTVFAGGFGVALSLTQDVTEQVNAIYGEGVNPITTSEVSGTRWRNAVYPMLAGTVPTNPVRTVGTTYPITTGDTDGLFSNGYDVITTLNAQLRQGGWPGVTIGSAFTSSTGSAITALKEDTGYANTNPYIGGTAEWALVFGTGTGYTDLASGYFQPLAAGSAVQPYTYAASGDVIGTASGYDPNVLRVDRTISYGDGVPKSAARANARRLINNAQGAWTGTITLTADPTDEAGNGRSRLDIREGSWIQVNNLNGGTYRQFYVAGVQIQPEAESFPVTLTVSQVPYDLLDLSTRLERNRDARENPAKSFYSQRTKSTRPFRSAVGWDAESGAGVVPRFAAAGSAWTVQRFVGAQYGQVGSLRVDTSPDAAYCFAVFGGSVSSTWLNSVVPSPLGTVTGGYPSWWQYPSNLAALATAGFIEAWGSNGEAAGYYPGAESIGGTVAGTVTGALEDSGSWSFASYEPPWLWAAIWPRTASTVTVDATMRIIVEE